ncbi:MAG TPA: hypothetical protein VMH02_08925 [Verrucomicrobiae bacterium]|nr:hypothetical protein [Verrucomicrobiae bacterium]
MDGLGVGTVFESCIVTCVATCAAGMKIVPPYPESDGSAVALGTAIGVNCPGNDATCTHAGALG